MGKVNTVTHYPNQGSCRITNFSDAQVLHRVILVRANGQRINLYTITQVAGAVVSSHKTGEEMAATSQVAEPWSAEPITKHASACGEKHKFLRRGVCA